MSDVPVEKRPAWSDAYQRLVSSAGRGVWAATDIRGVQEAVDAVGFDRCGDVYSAFLATYAMMETA